MTGWHQRRSLDNLLRPKARLDLEAMMLTGIKVVECGQGVAAAYAAKLLALLGADVIKVEPPQGDVTRLRGPFRDGTADPERSGMFIYLNSGKLGVTLDLTSAQDRDRFHQLLDRADILMHNVLPPDRAEMGLESEALHKAHPLLVITTISPYGDSGPRGQWRGYELNAFHASGMASLIPLGSPFPDLPPIKIYSNQAELMGGLHAAMVAVAAYWNRTHGGSGQAADVSMQECLAAMLELSLLYYTYSGHVTSRTNTAYSNAIECADGSALTTLLDEPQWQRLITVMGNPDWAHSEPFSTRVKRGINADALRVLMSDLWQNWKVADVCRALQEARIPVAPLNRIEDVLNDPHLHERGIFVRFPTGADHDPGVLAPGMPLKCTNFRAPEPARAPRLGEHNRAVFGNGVITPAKPAAHAPVQSGSRPAGAGPLAGVRVLDFTHVWAGPYCTLQLAHLGAEVMRVETAKRPCINRIIPPYADGQAGINRAGSFNQWNQGKRSLELDLANPRAVEIACELVRHCDVVTENFAPRVINRIGLGYDVLRKFKPDLVMLSVSGYGQYGPYRDYVSLGQQTAARAGMFWITGYPDDLPRQVGTSYADPVAGVFGAFAIISALLHRERTGQGQHIDLSMWETLEMMLAESIIEYDMTGQQPERMGNHDKWIAPHEAYKTLGDAEQWVTISTPNEREWRRLCEVIGQPGLADDPRFRTAELRKRNEAALDEIISAWTRSRDRWEVTEALQRAGVAAFPTLNNRDVAGDSHMRARGFLLERNHPEIGPRTHAGIPWTMTGTPCSVRAAAPVLGADTDSILSTILGYSAEQIAQLRADGVLN
jgi:crotonobetainyl-CoA:carnitine CoA-transferase CaiB-like acyl-CoA transferase